MKKEIEKKEKREKKKEIEKKEKKEEEQFDHSLVERFAVAQELAKYEVRKKKREEEMERVEESKIGKINILDIVKINEIWAVFLKDLGVDGTFCIGRYKIPYRKMAYGTFMHIPELDSLPNLGYRTHFKAGHVELRASGREVFSAIGRGSHVTTFVLDDEDNCYLVFDNEEEGVISAIGALAILRDNMRPFFDALVHYFSEKMNIKIGDVDIVGYDDVYDKAYKTLTCSDNRIGTRHILFAGEPGTGKSMLIKKLIQNKPKDVVVLNIDVDYEWEQIVPFLNELAKGTGRLIWIVIDEIDEYGVSRDISFSKTFELMRLLDGVSKNGNVRFIASTNRPGSLDSALLRVGRFGPIFHIDKPTEKQKKEIVYYYAKKYGADVDIERIVLETKNGFTGCDIRSAFENCIIYDEPLTTDNVVRNMSAIKTAMQYVDRSYV